MPASLVRARAHPVPVAIVFSVSLHLTLVGFGAKLVRGESRGSIPVAPPQPALASSEPASGDIDVEMPAFSSEPGAEPGIADPSHAEPPHPGGRDGIPRPDTGREGRAGTDEVSSAAVNLADRDDGIRLTPELASRLDRDQIQRLSTARWRASWEDARYTTNPMELTFLASGSGKRMERREPAPTDPATGAQHVPVASVRGSMRIAAEPLVEWGRAPRRAPGGARLGAAAASPGAGVAGGVPGAQHRESAAVASARPMVRQGAPSTPANEPGRPRDTLNSSQEVAASVQSLLHASTAGGQPGAGPGGKTGEGATGSGGVSGPGSRAEAMGQGTGGWAGADGPDPRLSAYRRKVVAKLWPLWENAFPRWAIAEMRQGQVIIAMVIAADGGVHDARVKRPSGIPEFDTKCLQAVVRASPFEPLPANLGLSRMSWEISFEASNPVVR